MKNDNTTQGNNKPSNNAEINPTQANKVYGNFSNDETIIICHKKYSVWALALKA